jgi:small subunit ribosomal protein S1
MDNQEQEGIIEEKSFAEFLAENPLEREWLQPGQKVQARIVKISPEWIFIDLGGKSEGYLDRKEYLDPEGNLTVKEGETVNVFFLSSRNNEKLFTCKIGRGDAAKAYLEDAWRSGIPVEGRISKETKGGLEVVIAGDVRAFCPFSQTGLTRSENITEYIGKTLPFKIMEYAEQGRNVIISHREILQEEKAKHKEELKEVLKEGMIVTGKVMSLHNFGAFVDIGGIQGLLPLSEIGYDRAAEINSLLTIGDVLSLSILKLDWDADKISLSLKANLVDPWTNIEKNFSKGACLTGRVSSLTNFGAFVTLEAGVEGLIHISKLAKGKRIKHASEVLAKGQSIEIRIEAIDTEKKRISLALAAADGEGAEKAGPGANEEKVEDLLKYMEEVKSTSFGSLGDLLKAKYAPKSDPDKRDK